MDEQIAVSEPRRNRSGGQVILVALLAVFPLLALLVLEQGRVIDSQRVLIRQLFADSQQLNALRVRSAQDNAKKAAPAPQNPPEAQAPAAKPAPDRKSKKGQSTSKKQGQEEIKPVGPQEYPATRPMPVRKAT